MTVQNSTSRIALLPPRAPKGGRPTQDIAARLGEHILEVALVQFIAHGPERTSMDDIAAIANVSKRTLYARHGSKIGLLVAAIKHGIDDRIKPLLLANYSGPPRERMMCAALNMLNLSLEPDVIGLEKLVHWAFDQKIDEIDVRAALGINPGIILIRSRHRILIREDLPNTNEAKLDYMERALDLLAEPLPFFRKASAVVETRAR